jgi:glycerol-3-phosphate dehydrogenase
VTKTLKVHGYTENGEKSNLSIYGSDAEQIRQLALADPEMQKQLHPDLNYIAAEVLWATRTEMAQSVEDILARRTRALFLNAKAAVEMAPTVAAVMAKELNKDVAWQKRQVDLFKDLAKQYVLA